MKTLKAQKLTKSAFSPYGEYYNFVEPDGHGLKGEIHVFYPDRIVASQPGNVGYSTLVVKKPEKMIIERAEYHTTTCEMIMPLNDDMILHVAEPSAGTPIPNETKAFIVPKNTLVKLKSCVWHLAPLPRKKDELMALIILPECTYINDCTVVDFDKEDIFEIVL